MFCFAFNITTPKTANCNCPVLEISFYLNLYWVPSPCLVSLEGYIWIDFIHYLHCEPWMIHMNFVFVRIHMNWFQSLSPIIYGRNGDQRLCLRFNCKFNGTFLGEKKNIGIGFMWWFFFQIRSIKDLSIFFSSQWYLYFYSNHWMCLLN